jgi:predicted short-subunit dehydrogenase-like oxidoreductase (DUF2520 family)
MADAGYPVLAVAARSLRSARRACKSLPGARALTDPAEASRGAGLVLIATPDREIRTVAARLASSGGAGWNGITVLHHAGSLGPDLLAPLRSKGAAVGVLHPLQAMGAGGSAELLAGSGARIEGDPAAVRAARSLARDLGLRPIRFRVPPGPGGRAGYHAAASMVSNDLLALLAMAADRMEASGADRRDALQGLLALARGSLENLESKGGMERALSGPVSRGDCEVLESQIRSLRRKSRDTAEVHRLLSLRLLELASSSGLVDRRIAARLRRVLA